MLYAAEQCIKLKCDHAVGARSESESQSESECLEAKEKDAALKLYEWAAEAALPGQESLLEGDSDEGWKSHVSLLVFSRLYTSYDYLPFVLQSLPESIPGTVG